MDLEPHVEGLLRELAPQTLAALTRRYGHFDLAEDAVQEALLAAATAWSAAPVPDNPAGWLTTVATRRLTDLLRSEQARRRREHTEAVRTLPLMPIPGAVGTPRSRRRRAGRLTGAACSSAAIRPSPRRPRSR